MPWTGKRIPSPCGRGQGEGDGGLQLLGTWGFAWRGALFSFAWSSRPHRQFAGAPICGAFLPPHPSPLPEERENRTRRFRQSGTPRLGATRDALFPEGQGEGAEYQIVFRQCIQRFPLSPALPARSSRGEGEEEAPPVPSALVAYPAD